MICIGKTFRNNAGISKILYFLSHKIDTLCKEYFLCCNTLISTLHMIESAKKRHRNRLLVGKKTVGLTDRPTYKHICENLYFRHKNTNNYPELQKADNLMCLARAWINQQKEKAFENNAQRIFMFTLAV